jgi:synaptobrevin homolog YKT6
MVKLTAVSIYKWNGGESSIPSTNFVCLVERFEGLQWQIRHRQYLLLIDLLFNLFFFTADKDPTLLGMAADLSTFGYFQRGSVKEMITFVGRTVAKRTQPGQRQTVQQDDFFCHVYNRDSLVGVAFVDKDYPVRSAFCVVNKILDDFSAVNGNRWKSTVEDSQDATPVLEPALAKYQVNTDPHRLQRQRPQAQCQLSTRWLVDGAGRQGAGGRGTKGPARGAEQLDRAGGRGTVGTARGAAQLDRESQGVFLGLSGGAADGQTNIATE